MDSENAGSSGLLLPGFVDKLSCDAYKTHNFFHRQLRRKTTLRCCGEGVFKSGKRSRFLNRVFGRSRIVQRQKIGLPAGAAGRGVQYKTNHKVPIVVFMLHQTHVVDVGISRICTLRHFNRIIPEGELIDSVGLSAMAKTIFGRNLPPGTIKHISLQT